MRQVVSRGCEQQSSIRLIILFTQLIYLCILLSGYRTKARLPLSFEKSLNLYLDAKPPKPPAMPCRWFFVFRREKIRISRAGNDYARLHISAWQAGGAAGALNRSTV